MKFFTEIPIKTQFENQIDYHSKIVGLGSCFVENIGEKLDYYKFQTILNPFGILFNPISIENLVNRSILGETYSEKEVFEHNEQFHCYDAHSDLNSSTIDEILLKLNDGLTRTSKALNEASHLIITFGTAWVYENKETKKVVANCHKKPQLNFTKKLSSIDSIVQSLASLEENLRNINPEISLIFTVSPVRHIKDGFIENTLSKSHLISAVHKIISSSEKSFYFPAYEIMMDELRDYRFYKEDLIHPNDVAIEVIWERFKDTWVSKESQSVLEKIDSIQKSLQHKPFNEKSEPHQRFLQKLADKKSQLLADFPHIKF